MADLPSRLALVTGGARGQGRRKPRLLAQRGASVIIAGVLFAEGESLAATMAQEGYNVCFIRLDVTDPGSWNEVVTLAREWRGRLIFSSTTRLSPTVRPWWLQTLRLGIGFSGSI